MHRRANSLLYSVLVVSPIILFSPILFTGKALFWGTPSTQFVPWWQTAWETILQGGLPFWNPWLGMGAPLLANYQSALLYPPTWSYFLLWLAGGTPVMAWGMAMVVTFHLIWASLGMAFLIRQMKLGILSQVIAGLAYGLSGYLVARAGFLSINAATAWTPWIILGVTRLIDELVNQELNQIPQDGAGRNSRWVRSKGIVAAGIILGVCVAMQLLSGHAQSTWYSLNLAGIWGIFQAHSSYRRDVNLGKSGTFIVKAFIILAGVLFVGICLAALQLLPTVEYLLQSQRSTAVDFEYAMTYSFWPWRWLTLIAPGLFGSPVSGDYWGYANFWEDAIYIGLVPFFLALAAVLSRRRRSKLVIFLVSIILVSTILSLGKNTHVFPWLYRHIPTFDMFQAPTRINLMVVFCLSVLAAIGASDWRRPTGRGLYWTRLGTMAAGAVTIGAFLSSVAIQQVLGEINPTFIRATALAGMWGVGLGVLTLTAPQNSDELFATRRSSIWGWGVILWVAADLIVAGWGLNPGIDLDFYRKSPQTADSAQEMAGSGRLFLPADSEEVLKFDWLFRFDTFAPFPPNIGWEFLRAALIPNTTSLDHILSANNFDPLLSGRYVNWMNVLDEANPEMKDRMLNLMAVNVVEIVDVERPYEINFQPRPSLPRVRWVPCGIVFRDGKDALTKLVQDGDYNNVVWLEIPLAPVFSDCATKQPADILIKSQRSNGLVIDINAPAAGYLVLADAWYPGWRAKLDGQLETIWRANYLFQAIEVPAGDHQLVVSYRPAWFPIGLAISALAWICIGVLVLYLRRFSS